MSQLSLVIMAAGMGSRYKGLKQIDQVGPNGEILLDYTIYDAWKNGFDEIVLIIRKSFQNEMEELINPRWLERIKIKYVCQELEDLPPSHILPTGRQKPWGTSHALLSIKDQVSSPFVILNADDFYGANALKAARAHFESFPDVNALIGYTLKDTLSKFGSVARGVCEESSNNFLNTIDEITNIEWKNEEIVYQGANKVFNKLDGEKLVSLNMWYFTPDIFSFFESDFITFLENYGNELKSERLIPQVVNDLLSQNKIKVKVVPSNSQWFGMTYQEDKDQVREQLLEKHQKQLYSDI